MNADRCPSCAGAIRPDSSWCGQCYADLRPAPAPVPATLVAGADATVSATAAAVPAPVELPTQAPAPAADAVPAAPAALTWPCVRCHTAVPIEEDNCPNCLAKFLDPELPGTDKTLLDRLPRERKSGLTAVVIIGGGLALTVVFIALFALLSLFI